MKMPRREGLYSPCLWILLTGIVAAVEITFENPEDGFFLKPIYQKNKAWDPLVDTESFVLTQPSDVYNLKATSGPFEVHQVIQSSDLGPSLLTGQGLSNPLVNYDVVFDFDVSAHIISNKLSPKWPKLQVLIHAGRRHKRKASKSKSSKHSGNRHEEEKLLWCGHVFALMNGVEESSICPLGDVSEACVTSISLPQDWFYINGTLQVSYAFSHSNQNKECASAFNNIVPGRSFESPLTSKRKSLAWFPLTWKQDEFEVKRDQHIMINVPVETFKPKSVFEIPVTLEAESELQVFVMRARVRNGLKISGAIAEADGPWEIHVDINERQKVGTVMARIRDISKYVKSAKDQNVFKWQMQVEEDVTNLSTGRIVWSVEYERERDTDERYAPPQESRIISLINIRSQEQERIVPVLKVTEFLNCALLTGKKQVYPLKVFSVKESDTLTDISSNAVCHSAEEDVLKVATNCSMVYVDGTERRGSHNVSIIVKSGRNTAFAYVKVWIPVDPLDIQVTDSRLSQIRGWKVPVKQSGRVRNRTRNKRVVDFGMFTHPSVYLSKRSKKYTRGSCQLKRQQALVEVYAQFYIATPSGKDFFKDRHAFLRITDLILDKLRVSDTRIASLNNKVLQGQGAGRTEIQVLSPSRRVVAFKEIRVSNDKVSVERMIITLVTGITLEFYPSLKIPGALTAVSHIQGHLHTRHQEAVIDVAIQYSDGSRFPLEHVDESEYILEVTTLNHYVIGLAPYTKPYQPSIVAMGQGRGEFLKVFLKLGRQCTRKKTRPLRVGYVVVHSDFSPNSRVFNDRYLSDGHYDENSASDRRDQDTKAVHLKKFKFPSIQDKDRYENDKKFSGKFDKKDKTDGPKIAVSNIDLRENMALESSQTKQEPVKTSEEEEFTPLQIGLYVLLAVFCVFIGVFFVNCLVFMMRYKRKRHLKSSKKDSVSSANDWVWIGRATLERNAVNTRCSQTLMPAEDFNGNHTQPSSSSSGLGSSGQNSAQTSNRSSYVSTIKGSECSIRITANPLLEKASVPTSASDNNNLNSNLHENHVDHEWDYEAMGLNYDQLVDYFDNLKESTA